MRALMIGPEEKAQLKRLKDYAEAHPFTMDDALDRLNGGAPPGDLPDFVCQFPVGFRVVFSLEPTTIRKLCRRVSISVDAPGRCPSIPACQMILNELGFVNTIGSQHLIIQMEGDAVNIAELI